MPTHEEFQAQVVELAHLHGWAHLHVRRTIGRGRKWTTSTNRKGWPDLFLWHPGRGGFVALEIKTAADVAASVRDGRLAEQGDVMRELRAAGASGGIVTPDDWPWIERVLNRRADDWPPPTPPEVVARSLP